MPRGLFFSSCLFVLINNNTLSIETSLVCFSFTLSSCACTYFLFIFPCAIPGALKYLLLHLRSWQTNFPQSSCLPAPVTAVSLYLPSCREAAKSPVWAPRARSPPLPSPGLSLHTLQVHWVGPWANEPKVVHPRGERCCSGYGRVHVSSLAPVCVSSEWKGVGQPTSAPSHAL